MGRQQRNRHPANRLGRRRSARVGETRTAHVHVPGNVAAGPDSMLQEDEMSNRHHPAGQNPPHQS